MYTQHTPIQPFSPLLAEVVAEEVKQLDVLAEVPGSGSPQTFAEAVGGSVLGLGPSLAMLGLVVARLPSWWSHGQQEASWDPAGYRQARSWVVVLRTAVVTGGSMVGGQKGEAAWGQTALVGGDEACSHGCSDDCKSAGLLDK